MYFQPGAEWETSIELKPVVNSSIIQKAGDVQRHRSTHSKDIISSGNSIIIGTGDLQKMGTIEETSRSEEMGTDLLSMVTNESTPIALENQMSTGGTELFSTFTADNGHATFDILTQSEISKYEEYKVNLNELFWFSSTEFNFFPQAATLDDSSADSETSDQELQYPIGNPETELASYGSLSAPELNYPSSLNFISESHSFRGRVQEPTSDKNTLTIAPILLTTARNTSPTNSPDSDVQNVGRKRVVMDAVVVPHPLTIIKHWRKEQDARRESRNTPFEPISILDIGGRLFTEELRPYPVLHQTERIFATQASLQWIEKNFNNIEICSLTYSYNPSAPKIPGYPGLLLTIGDPAPMSDRTCQLMVQVEPDQWQYMGRYEIIPAPSLSREEWLSQPESLQRFWSARIAEEEFGTIIRARITLKQHFGQWPTVEAGWDAVERCDRKAFSHITAEDIYNVYSSGEEQMHVHCLNCIGYDTQFVRCIANAPGNSEVTVDPSVAVTTRSKVEDAAKDRISKKKKAVSESSSRPKIMLKIKIPKNFSLKLAEPASTDELSSSRKSEHGHNQ